MTNENESATVDFSIVAAIVRIVFNETTKSLSGLSGISKAIPASYIFSQIKELKRCSDITFVQCLNAVKKEYPKIYNKIQLPEYWNGRSESYFPECYPSKGKLQYKVLRALSAKKVLPNVEKDRIWQPNEIIWISEDNETAFEYVDSGYLMII